MDKNLSDFNLSFEKVDEITPLPDQWVVFGFANVITETQQPCHGKKAILIEADKDAVPESFGGITRIIPAFFEGKEIELKGYLKSKEASGFGMMLRIDDASGPVFSQDLKAKELKGTNGWTQYSIKTKFPAGAKKIYIGAWLSGGGQLYADHFQVFIDGRDIQEYEVPIKFVSELDNEFDEGSKISTVPLDPETIGNLEVVCKVWGLLKYYHPSVSCGKYHWDYELFRILPPILEAKTEAHRNKILLDWIHSLGPSTRANQIDTIDSSFIKIKPDYSWINPATLGIGLTTKLKEVIESERNCEPYYVYLNPGVENPNFENETRYPLMGYPDAGYRLLALFRYWNIIQYYYPYRNLIEDWGDILSKNLRNFIQAKDVTDYQLCVLSLASAIKDTHAIVAANDYKLDYHKGLNYAPLKISFIEGRPVVIGYLSSREKVTAPLLEIGDVIETVDEKPVESIIDSYDSITPASNDAAKLRDIGRNLLRSNKQYLKVSYKRGDMKREEEIECYPLSQIDFGKSYVKTDTCFRLLHSDIAYIYHGTLKNEYLPKLWDNIEHTKGLIIDLRNYPSDHTVFTLTEYLLPEPVAFVKFTAPSIRLPGLFTFTSDLAKAGKVNQHFYKGKVIIIVNEVTQSASEFHAMAFKVSPNAIVIGSTTAGADGNTSTFSLPGGITTAISGIGVYYPDGGETQRVGIVPDIFVSPTIEGIRQNRDELLEVALDLIMSEK